jgi:glycosyltransferase involved in cell wall biosynthesis
LKDIKALYERDILQHVISAGEKQKIRQELEIAEEHMVLAIGQFIHRKGFDVLLKAAQSVSKDVGIYIVGGEATEEYLKLREDLGVTNVHFVGFQKKERLAEFYKAADLFVLPTREDVWGLVINEALAYGLPTITTDRCVAGLELIEDGVNGYVVPVEDEKILAEKISAVLSSDLQQMGEASLRKIRPYTLENMAKTHAEIFESGR